MDTDKLPVRELVLGLFLAVFFVAGFGAGSMIKQSNGDTSNDNTNMVDVDTAAENGETYLQNGPLSYPFTYNLSTESIEKVEIGNTEMYNWTVSYVVEANPLSGPTYSLPENQTQADKTMNLYITTDGKHIFPSQPIRITQ